ARGEVTTGAVKIGGIGAAGVVAAVLAGGSPADVVINAGLTAGGANLLNLFDLRPGRAIKVALAGAALLAGTGPAAAGAVAGWAAARPRAAPPVPGSRRRVPGSRRRAPPARRPHPRPVPLPRMAPLPPVPRSTAGAAHRRRGESRAQDPPRAPSRRDRAPGP